MAGLIEGFSPVEFREGIRTAMTIGMAPDSADQPVFMFPQDPVNLASADVEDIPFDPEARPTMPPPVEVRVPCAVEYVDAAGRTENFGVINPSKIRIILMDLDYAQVKGFSYVMIGTDKYNYAKTEPGVGLGAAGVWILHCVAEDET